MFKQFLHHIDHNRLFTKTDKVLLAVSGGLDSMVMLSLFKEAGFSIGVVHCNFQLRGEESKGDEVLVNLACVNHNIPFHLKRFDTRHYATEKGLSIQLAARELRYAFFNELTIDHGYTCVATAHHLNDSIETTLLNLIRGTGIDGVTGIPVRNENIVRPLLFATREEIHDYASFLRLEWREDASNSSDKYPRNFLRNQVIPLLKTLNPDFEHTFSETLERLRGTSALQKTMLRVFADKSIRKKEEQLRIIVSELKAMPMPEVVLWETLKSKGFSYAVCKEIIGVHHQAGRIFYSESFQLTVDRDDLIVTEKIREGDQSVTIDQQTSSVIRGRSTLVFNTLGDVRIDKDLLHATLDLDAVHFPLIWRKWREGDGFVPLGMQHKKKISDFLIDIKVPLPEKEHVTVLESAGEIIWLVGYRIADPYKITAKTTQILSIKLD